MSACPSLASPTWVLGAPSSLESGRGRAPKGGGWAQGCSSLPQDFQELTCSPSPRFGAWALGPLHLSKAAPTLSRRKSGVGSGRGGPRRLPSQAAPQQARVQTLPRRPVLCSQLGDSSGVTKKIKLVNDKDRIFHALGAGPDDLENELKWIQPLSLL